MQNSANLFGSYLYAKRTKNELTLRDFSDKLGISHVYLYKIENGIKPPPHDELLIKMVQCLKLTDEEKNLFFDIAAATKRINDNKNYQIPTDIKKYMSETKEAQTLIREASKINLPDEYWIELLNCLKNL